MLVDIRTGQVDGRVAGETPAISQGSARLQQSVETGQPDQRSNVGGEWVPELTLAAILLADDPMELGRITEEGGAGRHQKRVRRWRTHISGLEFANGRVGNDQ